MRASLTLGCKVEQGACDSKSKRRCSAGVGPRTTCSEGGWWDPEAFSLRQWWGSGYRGSRALFHLGTFAGPSWGKGERLSLRSVCRAKDGKEGPLSILR